MRIIVTVKKLTDGTIEIRCARAGSPISFPRPYHSMQQVKDALVSLGHAPDDVDGYLTNLGNANEPIELPECEVTNQQLKIAGFVGLL